MVSLSPFFMFCFKAPFCYSDILIPSLFLVPSFFFCMPLKALSEFLYFVS